MTIACPNCSAIWTMEEIEEQCCGACGYPNSDDDEPDFDGIDEDYDRPSQYEQAEMMHRIQRDLK